MTKSLIIASVLLCSSLFGQTPSRPDSVGTLTVLTDPPGADIFIDSSYVGKSPLQNISVQRGSHRIRAYSPSVLSWNALVTEEAVEVVGVLTIEKRLLLGKTLTIQTEPPNGNVLYGGKNLGVTPLYFSVEPFSSGHLTIQKSGFDSVVVPFNDIKEGFLRLQLRPSVGSNAGSSGDLRGMDLVATDHWPTYVSGLSMIVTGVTSAYLKDQANREFSRYLVSKDPAGLAATNKLDRGAAISLVISQISFVVLSYFLLTE
jgi:hypothetical protein